MNPDIQRKPLIPQPWLRALLCAFAYAILLAVVAVVMVFVIKANTAADASTQNINYIIPMAMALLTIAVVWVFRTKIDRRSFGSLGTTPAGHLPLAGAGFFLGCFILCAGACLLSFTGMLLWTGINFNGPGVFIGLVLMGVLSFAEEIFFRGYILNNLLQQLNKWIALPVSALMFAAVHAFSAGVSVVSVLNLFLLGCLLGLNYGYTGNLWFGITLHFAWKFVQGPLLGVGAANRIDEPLLQHELKSANLLTGGTNGFEGSVLATLFLVLTITALVFFFERKYSVETIPK